MVSRQSFWSWGRYSARSARVIGEIGAGASLTQARSSRRAQEVEHVLGHALDPRGEVREDPPIAAHRDPARRHVGDALAHVVDVELAAGVDEAREARTAVIVVRARARR